MSEPAENILVVDDNDAERYYVARVLSRAGFEVTEAANGQDALRLALEARPALVTLDIRLPDINGLEVCRRLKANPATRDVPVLHISASFTTAGNKAEGLEGGADGYLTHPVDANELVATVRALLRARQVEVQLRAAAREWTTTFDLIGDAVCLTTDGHRIARCNRAFAGLVGQSFDRIIGRPLVDVVPALASPAPGRGGDEPPAEIRIGERHYRVSVDPGPGAPAGATRAWVLGDITERQQHEEALRRSEDDAQARAREIEAVYRSAPVGLCVLDRDLRYVRLNARMAEMIGHPVEQLVGRTVRETTPALADTLEPRFRHLLATGEAVYGLEVRGTTDAEPGMERIWVATWLPLRDASGQVAAINVAAEEVTENRRLQEKLMEAHRLEAVGRLAGGVAHETNNQMTVVLGCAGFVLRHPGLPEPVRTDVEQIRQAAERTARITAQLLAYGRRQHLVPEVIDLDQVTERLRPFLLRALGDRHRLNLVTGSRGHRVKADVSQVEQMLLNLTLNARDAMPQGGTLTIETALATIPTRGSQTPQDDEIRPGEYVRLSVRDTGQGMTPSTLRRAFEPFFTTKPPGMGTGLGLSMVYGLVKQSGGSIRAESEPGRGTVIEIFLPLAAAPAETVTADPRRGAGQASSHVLVVEDDSLVRGVVTRELSSQGYRVVEAADGGAALEELAHSAEPFDLLITDLAMPGMDGRELAERAATLRPALPVLFMSGHPDEATRRVLSESDRPYLQKPFTPEELLARVEEILGRVG
ncbi:MAG TPA: response regulator [Gemmatimonadales bacterium]|nr:response regulator [Gemmatimonadales bacterium]